MSTSSIARVPGGMTARILDEGYGPGAWHGADMKAALEDVGPEVAFWRPGPGRHNIAEIAVHHAYYVHAVRSQLSGQTEPFLLSGEDWFDVPDEQSLSWSTVSATVESEHRALHDLVKDIDEGRRASAVADEERLKLVLGITCHAVYHAGQVQLIKRLKE